MNMVDLVLTVCLLSNPGSCREEHLFFESRGSLFQCMMLAPAQMAKWSAEHPAVRIARWTCAFPDKSRKI